MKRYQLIAILLPAVLLVPFAAWASIFGSVRGVVHDPQHRPIQGAHVTLKAQNSDWTQSQDSPDSGAFDFSFRAHRKLHGHSFLKGLPGSAPRRNCSIGYQPGAALRADDRRRERNCPRS